MCKPSVFIVFIYMLCALAAPALSAPAYNEIRINAKNSDDKSNYSLEIKLRRAVTSAKDDPDEALAKVKELLRAGANPNARVSLTGDERSNEYDYHPPMALLALRAGSPAIAKVLLAAGANPAAVDGENSSLLLAALEYSKPDLDLVKLLLKSNDINFTNRRLNSPLSAAFKNGADLGLLKFLVDNGANIRGALSNDPQSYLLKDMIRGVRDPQAIKFLLAQGLNPNQRTGAGQQSLLELALEENRTIWLQALLQAGADPSPLLQAARSWGDYALLQEINLPAQYAGQLEDIHQALLRAARRDVMASMRSRDFFRNASPQDVAYVLGSTSLAGVKFNDNFTSGITPLMLAAQNTPYPEVIDILIKAGVDPLAQQRAYTQARGDAAIHPGHNHTALHYAAWFNPNPLVVAELLKYKFDINAADGFGYTPLYLACLGKDGRNGLPRRLETVLLLLAHGASPDIGDRKDQQTPLMTAVYEGDLEKVQAMLPYSNLETANRRGNTALAYAFDQHHYAIAGELLRAGAHVNQKVLEEACADNSEDINEEMLRTMLASQSSEKLSALLPSACYNGAYRVVKALFAAGAKLEGTSCLTIALRKPFYDYYHTLEVLLQNGDDPNADLGAPLRLAAMQRKVHSVAVLLAHKANPNLGDLQGNTPLMVACLDAEGDILKNRVEVIKMLLKAGANVNAVNQKGECALMVAAFRIHQYDHMAVMELLVKAGTELNKVYPCGQTPLTFIMQPPYYDGLSNLHADERLSYARLMLEAGADPNLANAAGQTPIMMAEKYPEVKQLLLNAQNKPRPAVPAGNRNNSQRH